MEGCWLVVGAHHLVDVGHLRHQVWEFFGAGHLQSEHLVVVANHVLKRHLDGHQKTDSVVSLQFQIVLAQNSLVSEVAFSNQNHQVLEEALGASMLASLVPETQSELFAHHQNVFVEEIGPDLLLTVRLDEKVHRVDLSLQILRQ